MRISKTLMTGAVAAAAVAGSANAGFVDAFQQSSSAIAGASSVNTTQGGTWLGGIFDGRTTTATRGIGGATPSGGVATTCSSVTGGGSWVGSFSGDRPNSTTSSYAGVSYSSADVNGASIAFDKIMIDLAFGGTNRNAGSSIRFVFVSKNGGSSVAEFAFSGSALSAATLHIEFSQSDFVEDLSEGAGAVDWSSVTTLIVGMTSAGATGAGQTWSASNFQMTTVPAPGALALLGVAGLVGARRRR